MFTPSAAAVKVLDTQVTGIRFKEVQSLLENQMMRLFASLLIVLGLIYASPLLAAQSCRSVFTYAIAASRDIKQNSFFTARDLADYKAGFYADFSHSLNALKPSDTWIDLGAGKGRAAEDYFKQNGALSAKANVVLIAYKIDRWFRLPPYQGKLQVLEGRLLEHIPIAEIPKAKLMTDFFGVLSYSRDLSLALRIILDRLEIGGSLYLHSSNIHTTIYIDGTPMSLTRFLSGIPGLAVDGKHGILKVTKQAEGITIPLLRLSFLNELEKPPIRRFTN